MEPEFTPLSCSPLSGWAITGEETSVRVPNGVARASYYSSCKWVWTLPDLKACLPRNYFFKWSDLIVESQTIEIHKMKSKKFPFISFLSLAPQKWGHLWLHVSSWSFSGEIHTHSRVCLLFLSTKMGSDRLILTKPPIELFAFLPWSSHSESTFWS